MAYITYAVSAKVVRPTVSIILKVAVINGLSHN